VLGLVPCAAPAYDDAAVAEAEVAADEGSFDGWA
jgi:hypothetical protein